MNNTCKKKTDGLSFEKKPITVSVVACVLVIGMSLLWAVVLRANIDNGTDDANGMKQSGTKKVEQFIDVDLSWEKLPSGFNGYDIKLIYDSFEEKTHDWHKSEFETKDDYIKRIKKSSHFPLKGNLTTDSVLAFKRKPKSKTTENGAIDDDTAAYLMWEAQGILEGESPWKYDAEKQEYHSRIRVGGDIKIEKRKTDTQTYIGQNAFGAKNEIIQWSEFEYCMKTPSLATTIDEKLDRLKGSIPTSDFMEITINMSPQEAKRVKDRLNVLYIVKPSLENIHSYTGDEYGYISHKYSRDNPKIDSPYDIRRCSYYISAKVVQVWVVVEDSEKILKKITPVTDENRLTNPQQRGTMPNVNSFAIIGKLRRSQLYARSSKEYRYLILGDNDKIIAYALPAESAVNMDLYKFFDKKVGLVGKTERDPKYTDATLIRFTEIIEMK